MRIDGSVKKLYLGQGEAAAAQAKKVAAERQQRQEDRDVLRAEQTQVLTAEAALHDFLVMTDLLVKGVLILSNYHLNHGEWRRRREQSKRNCDPQTTLANEAKTQTCAKRIKEDSRPR
jgi:hypothetical protein